MPYKHKVAGSNPASTTIEFDLLIVQNGEQFLFSKGTVSRHAAVKLLPMRSASPRHPNTRLYTKPNRDMRQIKAEAHHKDTQ